MGKEADITMFNTNSPEWQPLYNPVYNLVYSATGSSVDTIMVGGKLLLQNGEHLTIDMERLYSKIKKLNPIILEKTNLHEKIKSKLTII
ncbi:hypothetical protein [Peribacillus cavernae]|uniref:hypothetical protein n=1 Tax=Peribacillus cavernae TaxID=1674310 RepID=UPI001FEBA8EA|nr:hypothetical protein [Peribacillus cavernae]